MNNHFRGSHLPANLNANNNCATSDHIVLDTVQVELVNEELEYQNHRLQKNLLQQENYVRRYWRNENDKQMIANNEWDKYNRLLQDERHFLFNNNVWRDGDRFHYQPNQNHEVISGTKEEIEIEASSRNPYNICFVDDLNDIKEIRFDTIYVSIKSIDVLTQCVYDPNSRYGKVNHINGISQNDFISTQYLDERFNDYSLGKEPSPVLYVIQNITTYKDHAFLANRMGKHFKNLKSDNTMVLVHNQDVADVIWNNIITKIYGKHNVKVLSDKMLNTQSVEEILEKTLYIRVDSIPDDYEKQEKLKQLITSVSIGYERVQLFITLDEIHPFLEEFLSATNMIFLDSMQNIIKKLKARDKIDLVRQIDNNILWFAKELSAIGSNPLNEYDYNNDLEKQKYLNSIYKVDGNTISSNGLLSPFDDSFDRLIHSDNRTHTYITGTSGSGKTTLLLSCIYCDVLRANGSVLVLDPQGDFGEALAKLPIDKERVVLIDPTLATEMTPTINQFELKNKSEQSIKLQANNIISFVKIINIDDKLGAAMDEMLYHCTCVLLRKGNSSFKELTLFMNDNKNDFLITLGKNSPDEDDREFFEDHFESPEATKTKAALRRRLKRLMSDHYFSNLMNGKETFDLEKLINTKGKIIILNVNKHNMPEHYKYFARFIIELVKRSAYNRRSIKKEDRIPCYFYCDEFQNYITPSIQELLSEIRQYKLYMTFSHQAITQITDPKLRDMIASLATTKLACSNSNKTLEFMKKAFNHNLDDLMTLQPGEFYLQAPNIEVIKVQNSDELLDAKIDITNEQWKELKQYQLENYYRSTKVFNFNEAVDEFVRKLLSENLDMKFFEPLQKYPEKYAEFFYNLVDDENGRFIAQPEMSFYFNIIYPDAHVSDNKLFLSDLRSRFEVFKQNSKDHKKYNDKFRYKVL
mgnify:CR=1 FL=1